MRITKGFVQAQIDTLNGMIQRQRQQIVEIETNIARLQGGLGSLEIIMAAFSAEKGSSPDKVMHDLAVSKGLVKPEESDNNE